ncbi:MAG: NAD(P)-dependent oxidoreductase [Geminicoccaceae bacterium]|nr:NAD(P)-dependent oxidoreductase [Geminicoccaceae bacterium]MCX8099743.1 NAD(P)-dependent oxidoreductase [Geminicoccaceae bacterium]MDW8369050.1 NAD(P)-dependent oxidoreductase [Geminicoccaceae bacterium]
MPRVVITGAAGSIGGKLRRHFESLGWPLVLLDRDSRGDPAIVEADLSTWNESWADRVAGADALLLLAGMAYPHASWTEVTRDNLDLVLNCFEAAVRGRVRRVIFASSNWVLGGYRFSDERLTPDLAPRPVNAYGMAKLVGERIGKSFVDRHGLSVICFRIGYAQREPGNRPGPHMNWGLWGQAMWLSDRDLCQGFEKAVTAPDTLRFAVLNLMSDNPGMRWDLEETRRLIGYVPQDGAAPVVTPEIEAEETVSRHGWAAMESIRDFLMRRRR